MRGRDAAKLALAALAAAGSPPGEPQRQVRFAGQIAENGRARGYFEVGEAGCSTGRIHWTAKPE